MFTKYVAMGLIVLFVLARLSGQAIAQESSSIGHWVSAWTTALYHPNSMPGIAAERNIADKTIRMIVRPSIGGQRLRVRFSNEFGTAPMTIASARIALTDGGSKIQMAGTASFTTEPVQAHSLDSTAMFCHFQVSPT